ncbi:hypothetical protein [Cohnella sp.]|uniref:hypothetical protein n=1 Tax=Cohnella sp. TaxID=1883426 RepID=UPI0035685784
MSRLVDIIENHHNLDQFFSIIKHYGVSAEYISDALIQQFEQKSEQSDGGKEETKEDIQVYPQELIDDLKQFYARF